ncbi:mannosyl-3-phosphoglycerate phosphatase [Catenovulum agarivorans DS-2]|uniref:Mannosyl-3-phosphoglycerate phosphatase n=1 Tax=Catenovulum agarivorans DS-2 TaxID=1328313 RepID=W7QCV4_9ALTE|nr:HAD-IIB family hydrolase [Catenovulum agarivorans]EWH09751.1 mannosyl-3-phosphoglycerate phosphatase [Catenovulum agarivorans DS-2]
MRSHKLIVFTDMDGTLLDHDTYSWHAAEPALAQLQEMDTPIICNTSKTYSEVKMLHQQLCLQYPFIVENGSAIYPSNAESADEAMHTIGAKRSTILKTLARLRDAGHKFSGFNDWSVQQIVEHTGLSADDAKLSGQRQYSEPLLYQGNQTDKQSFIQSIEAEGLMALQGGRFLSVQGSCDKGKALLWLKDYYQTLWQMPVITIALGDSQNDTAMLEAADISVWIKSHKPFPTLSKNKQVFYSNLLGPAGWNETMAHILQLYANNQLEQIEPTDS